MPIYITETGIADRSDANRALMIDEYMRAVRRVCAVACWCAVLLLRAGVQGWCAVLVCSAVAQGCVVVCSWGVPVCVQLCLAVMDSHTHTRTNPHAPHADAARHC
jgi:hypothetical protein